MRRHPRDTSPSRARDPCGGRFLTVPIGAASGDVFARERQDKIARIVEATAERGYRTLPTVRRVRRHDPQGSRRPREQGRLAAPTAEQSQPGALGPNGRSTSANDCRGRKGTDRGRRGRARADGDAIALDASTTALAMARRVRARWLAQSHGDHQRAADRDRARRTQGITVLMPAAGPLGSDVGGGPPGRWAVRPDQCPDRLRRRRRLRARGRPLGRDRRRGPDQASMVAAARGSSRSSTTRSGSGWRSRRSVRPRRSTPS